MPFTMRTAQIAGAWLWQNKVNVKNKFMEKFKKLSRVEMKAISGGQSGCFYGDYILCDPSGGSNYQCLTVLGDCDTPAQNCVAYGGNGAPGGCYTDDTCLTADVHCS